MSDFNVTVAGGKSVRLPTANTWCENDIIITAEGGGSSSDEAEMYIGLLQDTITDFESDKITKVADYAITYRENLKTLSLPNLKTSNTRAFAHNTSLITLSIPNMSGYTYQYMCAYDSALKNVDAKKARYISSYSFYSCSVLAKLEFVQVETIATNAFNGCLKLATLILRSESVATLSGTNAFTNTPIAKGTGYIYVPSALIDNYKAATNWSTYANQFRAIEDYPEITGG